MTRVATLSRSESTCLRDSHCSAASRRTKSHPPCLWNACKLSEQGSLCVGMKRTMRWLLQKSLGKSELPAAFFARPTIDAGEGAAAAAEFTQALRCVTLRCGAMLCCQLHARLEISFSSSFSLSFRWAAARRFSGFGFCSPVAGSGLSK